MEVTRHSTFYVQRFVESMIDQKSKILVGNAILVFKKVYGASATRREMSNGIKNTSGICSDFVIAS
jgi:hypothetical protein